MSENVRHFAVCIRNEEHEESLELRKIYEVLEDPGAAKHNMIRVIDEEGEDYLYPNDWFLPIHLPHNIEEAIVELTHS
jgi:primosomal protein N'